MSVAFECQQALFFGDVLNNPDAPASLRIAASKAGSFSVLVAPLLWEGRGIGAFHIARDADATFSDREVALLKTFADQAAIAIQNARLFDEVQARTRELAESLEQQTATSEVLEVISSTPGELAPVFQKMLENATRVCGANFGIMNLWDGEKFNIVAGHNVARMQQPCGSPTKREYPCRLSGSFEIPRQMQRRAVLGTPT